MPKTQPPAPPARLEEHVRLVNLAVGITIRCLRARLGLSQEAFGRQADVHRNFVGFIERGDGNPTLRVLVKFARGTRLPLDEIWQEFIRCLADTYARQAAEA